MKKIIIFSAASFALMLGACSSSSNKAEQKNSSDSLISKKADTTQTFTLDTTKLKSGAAFYQCDMDPEVLSDKPGNCPKCEMELTEIKKK